METPAKENYLIAIDQSTQGTKAMLLDGVGQFVLRTDRPHRQLINAKGWVGHDGEEIRKNLFLTVQDLLEKTGVDRRKIVGVAVTNQRESVLVWDRITGKPVCESIVWQCNRAAAICEEIERNGGYPEIHARTGLRPSPYFSAGKVAWILRTIPGAMDRARKGELCLGTMDCWSIYCLTGGKVHKTDCSNAARTQLYNLFEMQWDEEICRIFDIPMSMLPEVCDSDALYGETDFGGLLERPIPIHAAVGDSHGVLFAHGCLEKGSCMAGYGTGTAVLMNIGDRPILSNHGINACVGWRIAGKTCYAYDGVINYSGAVISWLKNDVKLIASPGESETLARQANPDDHTYLVSAFTGIGAPHWKSNAAAAYIGMTRLTGRAELVRAAVDSIAYQVADVVDAMCQDAGTTVPSLRVAGGPANNGYLMQFQSDILGCPVLLPNHEELSGIGAGWMAGLALGLYNSEELKKVIQLSTYRPTMEDTERLRRKQGWQKALRCVLGE